MANFPKLTANVIKSKDGTEIFAEACGDPSKQAVVFIHGFACAGTIFDSLFALETLQKDIFLVRFDTRAHGRSGKPLKPEAYESARYAEDFDAVCQAFNIRSSPIIAAWSIGGLITADVFAHSKIKPKGLIYISSTPYKGPADYLTPLCIEAMGAYLRPDTTADQAFTVISKFCAAFTAPDRASSVPFSVLASWIGTATQLPPSCVVVSEARKEEPAALIQAAKDGLPLCFIQGKDDLLVIGDRLLKHVESHFSEIETHLLDGVGHLTFWEEPTIVADIISTFVARLTGSKW